MGKTLRVFSIDGLIVCCIFVLIFLSTFILRSVMPSLYPDYFIYLVIALVVFYMVLRIDFEIFEVFSPFFYILCILLLLLPLIIGQVTRGAIRWIPLGSVSLQPSELVRPFLLLSLSRYLISKETTVKHLAKTLILFFIPFFLILVQPSLGVAILTAIGFVGIILASSIDKKYVFFAVVALFLSIPILWLFLAPYQKERIFTFMDPSKDPRGAGYNSIQAMITVGSGGLSGRGLGEGVQTQLKFLPEKHTDFIFAAISEELGIIGSSIVLVTLFVIFWVLIIIIEKARSHAARAFVTGILLVLVSETFIHIGMNMGLVPITGVPLPFVSAGGSALIGTTISIGLCLNAKKNN